MAHGYPIGKAQATVLNALGREANDFAEAERIFAEIGIQVTSKRGVPVVKKIGLVGYFGADGEADVFDTADKNVDYAVLAQWMA